MADSKIDSFKGILSGKDAFYNQSDYLKNTQADLERKKALPISFVSNTESKVKRIAKEILSIIIFPIGIYHLLQALAAKVGILPASCPFVLEKFAGYPPNYAHNLRANTPLNSDWKYKRFSVEVDGYKIDAMVMGKASTFNNGRWLLDAGGNGEFYEQKMNSHEFKQILSSVNANGILFSYPGVTASSGLPNRTAMGKAYEVMLRLLEDQDKGIGAKEIICNGHSISGGGQNLALKAHAFKKDIKYVAVKSRTFTSLFDAAHSLTGLFLAIMVKLLRWDMNNVEMSNALPIPEIIMQTANVFDYEELKDSSKIIDDGMIKAGDALGKALLDQKQPLKNKIIIGMPEMHNDGLNDPSFLAEKIEQLLKI